MPSYPSYRALDREVVADGFLSAFRKEAGVVAQALQNPRVHAALGAAGALGGIGAVGGGLLGAGTAGVEAYRQAKETGASTGQALTSSMVSGLSGAGRGAIRGAALGAAGGAALGGISPGAGNFVARARELPGIGAAARLGQRQTHALTGWLPEQGNVRSLGQLRMGSSVQKENLAKAQDALQAAKAQTHGSPEQLEKAVGRAGREVEQSRRGLEAAEKAEDWGLTSIPGYLRSVRERGLLPTMRTGAEEQWHSMSPGWKAVSLGVPAIEMASALRAPEGPDGPGRGERLGRGIGAAVGGMAMGGIPQLTGSLLVTPFLSGAGAMAGRGVDKIRNFGSGGAPDVRR